MFGSFKKEKLPKEIRRALKPSPDFVRKTKNVFLTEWHNRFGAAPRTAPKFSFAYKTIIAILVVLGLMGGASVYADAKNVGAGNILYPLKRYNESLQLVLAKTSDQPVLHIKFAKRRLAELEDLKSTSSTASSTQVNAVKEDMEQDIKTSLMVTDEKDYPEEKLPSFCRSFGDFVGTASQDLEDVIVKHPNITEKYQSKCAKFLERNNSDEDGGRLKVENQAATSTATSTELQGSHEDKQRGRDKKTGGDLIRGKSNLESKVENNNN